MVWRRNERGSAAAERRGGGGPVRSRGGAGFTIVSRSQETKEGHDGTSRSSRKVFRDDGRRSNTRGGSHHEDGWTAVVPRRRGRSSWNQTFSRLPKHKIPGGDHRGVVGNRSGQRSHQGVCFRCGGRDHIASHCRDPVICFTCKRTGHKSFNCSQRSNKKMSGWVSDIGLGASEDMRRRIEQLKTCGVVSLLQGSCRLADVSSILQRKTGDRRWAFDCTRLKDLDHFLVRCRTEKMLQDLTNEGAFGEGRTLIAVEPWSMNWGCSRRLGCGDPRWIEVIGVPIHAWGKLELQEVFDMEGEVMEVRPSGSLRRDHMVANVLFDARDWDALPNWIEKRIATAVFKIFIRKGNLSPRRVRPVGLHHLSKDASSAVQYQPRVQAPVGAEVPPQLALPPPPLMPQHQPLPQPQASDPGTSKWLEKGKWPSGTEPVIPAHVLCPSPVVAPAAAPQVTAEAGSPEPMAVIPAVAAINPIVAEKIASPFQPGELVGFGSNFKFSNLEGVGTCVGGTLTVEELMGVSLGTLPVSPVITSPGYSSDEYVPESDPSQMMAVDEVHEISSDSMQVDETSLIITKEAVGREPPKPVKRSARLQSKQELQDKLRLMAEQGKELEELEDDELAEISKSWAFKELDDELTLKEALARIKRAMKKV